MTSFLEAVLFMVAFLLVFLVLWTDRTAQRGASARIATARVPVRKR